jgi:hypothetical protein
MEKTREHPYAKHIEKAARKLLGHPTPPHAEQYLNMWYMYDQRAKLEKSRGGVDTSWYDNDNHLMASAGYELRRLLKDGGTDKQMHTDARSVAVADQAAYFRMIGAAQVLVDEVGKPGTTVARGQRLALRFHLTLLDYFDRGYHPDTSMDQYVTEFGPCIDERDMEVMVDADDIHLPIIEAMFDDPYILGLELWEAEDGDYGDADDPETEAMHKQNTADTVAKVAAILCPGYELRSGEDIRKGEKRAESGLEDRLIDVWYVLNSNTDIVGQGDSVVAALVSAKMW